jgi:hypothetical protein
MPMFDRGLNNITRPTMTIRGHVVAQAVMAVGVSFFQLNVIPVISSFIPLALQCAFFEQYRFKHVKYTIMPLQNVNTGSNNLLTVYDVPIYSN